MSAGIRLLSMTCATALAAGCQTFSALPEEPRLTALVVAPPDYSVFEQRKQRDATAARSLGGNVSSLELARLENDEEFLVLKDNKKLQDRLKEFYAPLVPGALEKAPNSDLYVAASPNLNAHALNTGDIVVEAGVVTSIDSFDEINFVLAHEGAHVLLDHFRSDELKNAANTATSLAYLAAAFADNQKNAAAYRAGGGPSGQLSYATLAAVGFAAITNFLAERREKQQEIEADQLGLEMLVAAPAYNSQLGANTLIRRLVTNATTEVEAEKAEIARIEADLERVCGPKKSFGSMFLGEILSGALPAPALADSRPQACQLRDQGLLQLDGDMKEKEASLKRAEERLDLMGQYQALRYNDVTTYPALTKISTADGQNSFAALFDPNGPVARGEEVRQVRARLAADDCKGAQLLARQFTQKRGGDADSYGPLREAWFDADADPKCDAPDAGRHARIANENSEASPAFLKKAFAYYNSRGKFADALKMLEAYAGRSGDKDGVMPDTIRLLVQLDRIDEAKSLEASCAGDESLQRSLKKLCADYLATALAAKAAPSGAAPAAMQASLLIETLSYNVIRAAFERDDIRALLPANTHYVFYIPTDAALAEATAGDPNELLNPEHRRLLVDIIRSHIVVKPQEVASVEKLGGPGPRPLPSGVHASAVGEDSFLKHVAALNGVVFNVGIRGADGEAYLTDTVLLKAD